MACSLPVVCSRIRGSADLIEETEFLVNPKDEKEFVSVILKMNENDEMRKNFGEKNACCVKSFEKKVVLDQMALIYKQQPK